MQLTCKCLNVVIDSKSEVIEEAGKHLDDGTSNHPFFNEDVGSVELAGISKEQGVLVEVHNVSTWIVHRCLNCSMYTHALNTSNTVSILVNRKLITDPNEIAALRNSEKFSPVFHIIISSSEEDLITSKAAAPRITPGASALHQQLAEWIQRESSLTEEKVRIYSDEQYAALELLRTRAHSDHCALVRLLNGSAATSALDKALAPQVTTASFTAVNIADANSFTSTPVKSSVPFTVGSPDNPTKKLTQQTNKARLPVRSFSATMRKQSVDAEGLFPLEGMDNPSPDTFHSDEDLTDTDDSGSHDEGIHIPRRVGSFTYAKSLPVDVPVFVHDRGGFEHSHEMSPQEPMDIAASIKALAKSVHGDTVFGDLPRPRFSSQI